MSPVKKRALVTTVTAVAVLASQLVAGPTAYAAETPDTSETAPSVTESVEPVADGSLSALEALGAEEDAAAEEAAAENGAAGTDTAVPNEQPVAAESGSEATAENNTATNQPTGSEAAAETAPATPAKTNVWIDKGFANWNFKDSFREYVGVEHEERIGVGLVGDRFSWYPKNDQKFDITNPTRVRFGGEVQWNKYEGILQVHLSNPTVDFQKKQLLVDAYTKGTLAGGGELTVTQEPLLELEDLKWENRDGYILVYSLKPRITELSQRILGFYKGEIGAPFVATLETRELGPNKAPQPVLSELFPKEFPSNEKQLSDPSEPVRDLTVPDANLRACILWELDLKEGTPITNKVVEQLQSFKCLNPAKAEKRIESLEGLQHAKNLTTLNLNYNNISDLTPIAGLTKLKSLEVANNKLRSVEALAGLTELTTLDVSENKLANLKGIEKMSKLERLVANDNRISDLSALPPSAEELSHLDLSKNRVSDLSPLATELWLREVYLDNNRITSLKGIDKHRGIRKLTIHKNYIEDPSALAVWGEREHVVSIKVSENAFTDWSVLEKAKQKIRDWPEAGAEAESTNPVKLADALAADAKIDAEDPAPVKPVVEDKPQSEAPSSMQEVKELTADLEWGVRASFIRYLNTPFVGGTWKLSDGAKDQFVFPLAKNQKVVRDGLVKAQFAGKIHFQGHHGLLDLSIAEPSIDKTPAGWKLSATVASKPFAMPGATPRAFRSAGTNAPEASLVPARVILADLSDPVVSTAGDVTTYTFSKVELTPAGAAAFGNFYREGDRVMDPLSLSIRTAPATEKPQSGESTGETSEDPKQPGDQNQPADKEQSAEGPQSGKPSKETLIAGDGNGKGAATPQNNPNKPAAPAKKECKVDPYKMRITSGTLSWGVRTSFTSYIRGNIAKGGWDLSGVNWDGSDFNFPVSGGVYNTNARTGTIYYSGSVHFHGHNGILDLTMSNPAIEINGNSGSLYLTVRGSDTSGNKFDLGRVHFANISFNGVYAANGTLSFDGASVTLSGSGAQAFAGFYNAGESLNAMSSSTTMVPATACDPLTGELIEYNAFGENIGAAGLASTGAEAGALAGLSLSILLMGALAMRRRYAA